MGNTLMPNRGVSDRLVVVGHTSRNSLWRDTTCGSYLLVLIVPIVVAIMLIVLLIMGL